MPRRRRPALWPIALLIALLIATPVVLGIANLLSGDDPEPPPPTDPVPTAYRVVYQVESISGNDSTVSTEELWVERPFRGRVEVREGSPPGNDVLSTQIAGFAELERQSSGSEPIRVTVEPSPPPGDVRVNQNFDVAVDLGLLTRTDERDEILGRPCDLFTVPLLSPSGADEGDIRQVCIDFQGLVLEDERTVGGEVVRRSRAVEVVAGPDALDEVPRDLFALTADHLGLDIGGGLTELTPDSRVGVATVYELAEPPAGFEHRGRFALTPASPSVAAGGPPAGDRIVGVVDVFERGPDFIAVFNGGADDGTDPFARAAASRPVDLGDIGRGEVVVSLSGIEVRADLGEGRFVRVFGTVPARDLLALARALEPFTDGEIIPLDDSESGESGESGESAQR